MPTMRSCSLQTLPAYCCLLSSFWLLCCARALTPLPSPSFPPLDPSPLFLEAFPWPFSSCIPCPLSFPPSASTSSAVHCLFVLCLCLT